MPPEPRLGFGASGPWAERWFSEEKAYAVLRAGVTAGIRIVDTGPSYAGGHAETRLGRLLQRLAEDGLPAPRVSSKVGTQIGEDRRLIKEFGADAIERQLDASLSALGRPNLDVLYLHGPDEHQLASALPTLTKQKELGRIKAVGVCCDGDHVTRAVRAPGVDWIMAPFNVLDQGNLTGLKAARAAGVNVCVVAPLAQALWRRGVLLPRSLPGAWYAARALLRNRDALRAARRAAWLRGVAGWTPAELALAFVREAAAPDLVLTTTTNPSHIRQSAGAMERAVPPALAARLQGLIVS